MFSEHNHVRWNCYVFTFQDQKDNNAPNHELETTILKTKDAARSLKKQLQDTAMDQASDLFKTNEDHELLAALKQAGLSGEPARVDELAVKFEEHSDQLQEVGVMYHILLGGECPRVSAKCWLYWLIEVFYMYWAIFILWVAAVMLYWRNRMCS